MTSFFEDDILPSFLDYLIIIAHDILGVEGLPSPVSGGPESAAQGAGPYGKVGTRKPFLKQRR